jgi:hypothetical protein
MYNSYLQQAPFNTGLVGFQAGFLKHKSYCVDYSVRHAERGNYVESEPVNPVLSQNANSGKRKYKIIPLCTVSAYGGVEE